MLEILIEKYHCVGSTKMRGQFLLNCAVISMCFWVQVYLIWTEPTQVSTPAKPIIHVIACFNNVSQRRDMDSPMKIIHLTTERTSKNLRNSALLLRKYKLYLSFTFSRNRFPGHKTAEEKISNRAHPSKINTNAKNINDCISTPFTEIECSWCWHLASPCFISPLLRNHHSYRCCRNKEHEASCKILNFMKWDGNLDIKTYRKLIGRQQF